MPELAILILVAVGILLFKHTLADFFLQTSYQYLNKGIYGHPGGLIHSAIHVALTPLVYLVLVPGSLLVALGLAFGEFFVHYHVDWLKERIVHRNGWTVQEHNFWSALGTDQFVHGLTYLAMVAILLITAAA